MKFPYKKMAHIPVYTVGFHSSAKSHKSDVYKWVNIYYVSAKGLQSHSTLGQSVLSSWKTVYLFIFSHVV